MEAIQHLRIKRLAAGVAAIALPPPGRLPAAPLPGAMPMSPYLHGIELTEAPPDKLFALMHDQAPNERQQLKGALRAMEDLRRLVAASRFDDRIGSRGCGR